MYRLDDSKMTVYTRSQLLLANDELQPQMNLPETFEVERFIGKKKMGGLVHYRVKWKGSPSSWHMRKELLKDLGPANMKELENDYKSR